MLESVMSEDATREALGTTEDTPVVEAGIKVEFSEEEGAVESDFFPQGKESVHGRSPFLSTKNADFPQTIGTKVSSPKEKKSKPIVSRGKKKMSH
ncbi:hypothetical protein Hanom_Chr12g01093741 [Helianthus anomalus]